MTYAEILPNLPLIKEGNLPLSQRGLGGFPISPAFDTPSVNALLN